MSAEETIRAYIGKRIDRREFIDRLCSLGVTAGAAVSYAELLTGYELLSTNSAAAAANEPRGALEPSEFKLVEAISSRILPSTDTPGAVEAGSVFYIDKALADPYRTQLPRYRAALAGLERHCVTSFGKSFTAIDSAQQDAVLGMLEDGKIGEVEGGAQFFELVRRHVMEGFFCEPYYGGNRDMLGWKLVGFPGQQYGYDDPYINKRIDIPPVTNSYPPTKGR
jgi:gluconate 2-dehydrogenase gamma chain